MVEDVEVIEKPKTFVLLSDPKYGRSRVTKEEVEKSVNVSYSYDNVAYGSFYSVYYCEAGREKEIIRKNVKRYLLAVSRLREELNKVSEVLALLADQYPEEK